MKGNLRGSCTFQNLFVLIIESLLELGTLCIQSTCVRVAIGIGTCKCEGH